MTTKVLAQNLLKSRKAIKKKFEDLQNDVMRSENYLERKFKPIADPLNQLLKKVKYEPKNIKTESDIKNETAADASPQAFSTPKKKSSSTTPSKHAGEFPKQRRLKFLETEEIASTNGADEIMEDDPSSDAAEFSHINPKQILQEIEQSDVFQNYIDVYSGLAREYISGAYLDVKRVYDITYGPKRELKRDENGIEYDTGKWMLGKSYLDFSPDGKIIQITMPDKKMFDYQGSVALYELIFKTNPNRAVVDSDDQAVRDYKDILNRTNVHRHNFDASKQIKGNTGRKYQEFIKPILEGNYGQVEDFTPSPFDRPPRHDKLRPRTKSMTHLKPNKKYQTGKGYAMNLNDKKVEYVPYKDLNKLVDRLRILIGSQIAGNTSHNNEIIFIIDELRRNKIIK